MKKVTLALLCLAWSYPAAAQTHSNSLQIGVGKLSGTMLDRQASPLLYQTQATQVAIGFEHKSQRARFDVGIAPAIGTTLPERFGTRSYGDDFYQYKVRSAYYKADISLSYVRRLGKRAADLKLFAGAQLQNNLQVADQVANFYWATNVAALQARMLAEYTHNRHRLMAGVSVPVLAAVSRHIYANFPKSADESNFLSFFRQGTRLTGPHKLHMVQLTTQYQFMLSRRFSAAAHYSFSYMKYPSPRPIQAISQTGTVSTAYHF